MDEVAFELHQATERCYAAIWLVFWDYKPKTHDLEKLAKRVRVLHALTEQLCLEKIDDIFPEGQSED